jgi:hypothetical protein
VRVPSTALVVRGLSTREIARLIYISEYTVQRHVSNIFEKVGTHSRPALMKRLFFEQLLPSVGDEPNADALDGAGRSG